MTETMGRGRKAHRQAYSARSRDTDAGTQRVLPPRARLSGWRVEWLDQHLVQWRAEIDRLERAGTKPQSWIERERADIHEYETMLLEAKYPIDDRELFRRPRLSDDR